MPKQHQLFYVMWMVDDGWINWVGKLNISQISQEPGSECLEAGYPRDKGDHGRPWETTVPNGSKWLVLNLRFLHAFAA